MGRVAKIVGLASVLILAVVAVAFLGFATTRLIASPATVAIVSTGHAPVPTWTSTVAPTLSPTPSNTPTLEPTKIPTATPAPTLSAEQFLEQVQEVPYRELARHTEDYIGKFLKMYGKVIQVVGEDGNDYVLLVNVTYGQYAWSDTVLVVCSDCPDRPLEDDLVFFIGLVTGRQDYETVLGKPVTVPALVSNIFIINE